MKKRYATPTIMVHEVAGATSLMAASIQLNGKIQDESANDIDINWGGDNTNDKSGSGSTGFWGD